MKFKIFYLVGRLPANDTYKLPDHSIVPYILSLLMQFVNVCNGEIIDKIQSKNPAIFPIFDVISTILKLPRLPRRAGEAETCFSWVFCPFERSSAPVHFPDKAPVSGETGAHITSGGRCWSGWCRAGSTCRPFSSAPRGSRFR